MFDENSVNSFVAAQVADYVQCKAELNVKHLQCDIGTINDILLHKGATVVQESDGQFTGGYYSTHILIDDTRYIIDYAPDNAADSCKSCNNAAYVDWKSKNLCAIIMAFQPEN